MNNKSKIQAAARQLVPMDDIMFRKMAEDRLFCQEILRVIMKDPDLEVIQNIPQRSVTNLKGRSIILDAYCKLGDGREINIEVQKANDDDHQKRVRYNEALLTANITEPGTKFENVPNVCIIFISRFDVFKDGLPLYHVERVVKETGKTVYNGFEEIYVNSAVNDGSDISELMEVFTDGASYSDKFPRTSEGKRRYRETEEGQQIMCDIMEKLAAEAREEGKESSKLDDIRNVMASFGVSLEKAMDSLKIPDEQRTLFASIIERG